MKMSPDRLLMNNYGTPPVKFISGKGTLLLDEHGKEYLDFLSGLAVTSLGHSHPKIAEALANQAQTLLHVSNLFDTDPHLEVAEYLDELIRKETGIKTPGRVIFQNSGAEANEAAIKLARKYQGPGRHVVLSALRSFHGRTLATLAATGQPEKHQQFQPLPEGFRHAIWNDLESFSSLVDSSVGAILLEPVQGEGGVNPADPGFLKGIRDLCDENNVLLIMDEIQAGVLEHIIRPILPEELLTETTQYLINPTGNFIIGGPVGDCGLTGRKIIVDTYGGMARHGGGAFSGKDPSKVDRSAAYAARYVAKNIVAAGLADRCEIQVSYAIGVAKPTSVRVKTFGTEKVSEEKIVHLVNENFDLTPYGIMNMLDLLQPIYEKSAAYGHFGREDESFPWEKTDRSDALKEQSGL